MRPRAAAAVAIAWAALLGLGGCATWVPEQTRALHAQAPADLPPAAEKRSVPFFPQTPDHCGPAALATVLADAGLAADPATLIESVFLPARGGTLQLEMLAGARRHGAVATRLPARIEALLREVAAGHPVVVLLNLGLAFAPVWHYAVLVGYDLPADEVLLRSGTVERQAMGLATFERTWARADHWAIGVLPPGRLPVSAAEDEAAQAALGFARVAPPAQAAAAYRAVLDRWPANLVAGFGWAHSLHAMGDAAGAARAFAAVAARHDSAAAWNNLARLQALLGEHAAAHESAAQALRRAEAAEPQWRAASRATWAAIHNEAPADPGPP